LALKQRNAKFNGQYEKGLEEVHFLQPPFHLTTPPKKPMGKKKSAFSRELVGISIEGKSSRISR